MTVLAAVLTGPLLATCSTKENTARPFGATFSFDAFGFGRCEADAQDLSASLAGWEWGSSCAGHDMNIAGHRKLVNGVDGRDLRGHNKDMNTAASIHLQGLGAVQAKMASELQVGDTMHFNFGQTAEVVAISPAGKNSIRVNLITPSGFAATKLYRRSRLVAS